MLRARNRGAERRLGLGWSITCASLSWLLIASAPGSLRFRLRTRLEPTHAIAENCMVLSGVIERVRITATRVAGRIADAARAATRPAPVVVGAGP